MNGVYDINCDLFFQLDEGGWRGHDQKLFKKRFRLNITQYAFGKRYILITGTRYLQIVFIVKLLRSISRLHLNRELYSLEVSRYNSNIRRKPVLTYASTVCGIAGVGEFGEW